MKALVFIEDFSSKYHLPEGDIVALNIRSHYELLKRGIDHYTISDLVDFESYLTHSEAYNNHQKRFFKYCDKIYKRTKLNNRIEFSPFKILGYDFKYIFDSLYAQSIIIYRIIQKVKPKKVVLFSSYKLSSIQINYLELDRDRYYKFLFYEILEYLSTLCNYNFESIIINKSYSQKINSIKELSKEKVKDYKYYNVFRQKLLYKNLNSKKVENYDIFKNTNNLFINQVFIMDKIIKYSLVSNSRTIVLRGKYLFFYKRSRITGCIPLLINNLKSNKVLTHNYETQARYFNDFVHETLGLSLYNPIYNRLKYLNSHIIPDLLEGCIIVNKMLKKFNVEKVIGNMKDSTLKHIIAFIATYDSNYSYFHFTHGYDPYVIDRTFLELPCNYYITLNEEYRSYFKNSFKDQNVYKIPKVEVI